MTQHELHAELTQTMLERPELFEAARQNRARLAEGESPRTVSSDERSEHELGALVLDVLHEHPRALQAMRENRLRALERQAKPAVKPSSGGAVCPFCGAPGEPVQVTIRGQDRTFTRLRPDCCREALLESASRALRYARNSDGPENERVENAQRYLALRGKLNRREDLAVLDRLEADLEARSGHRGPSYARKGSAL